MAHHEKRLHTSARCLSSCSSHTRRYGRKPVAVAPLASPRNSANDMRILRLPLSRHRCRLAFRHRHAAFRYGFGANGSCARVAIRCDTLAWRVMLVAGEVPSRTHEGKAPHGRHHRPTGRGAREGAPRLAEGDPPPPRYYTFIPRRPSAHS